MASQQQYLVHDSIIDIKNIIYDPSVTHRTLVSKDWDTLKSYQYLTGTPEMYALNPVTRRLMLHPCPSSAATSTALNGALTAAATTVTVDDTTSFGSRGRIKVDDEIISYTGTTSTTFTGCVRGEDGTIARSHTDDSTVTWQNLEMECAVKPTEMVRVYSTGTVAITNAAKALTGTSTLWNTGRNIIVGNYFGVGSYETTPTGATFPQRWYEVDAVTSDTAATIKLAYNETTETAGNYIITDKSDFPEEAGDDLLKGMKLIALVVVSSPRAESMRAEWFQALGIGTVSDISEDYLPQFRSRMMAVIDGPQPNDSDYPWIVW